MIKGLHAGYSGLVYIYYHGPMRIVLSDVNAGFANSDTEAATALRVVLRPMQWTEIAYSYIKESFEGSRGQLKYLAQDGYVDIYTDAAEVAQVKRSQKVENWDKDRGVDFDIRLAKGAMSQPVGVQQENPVHEVVRQEQAVAGEEVKQEENVPEVVQQANEFVTTHSRFFDLHNLPKEAVAQSAPLQVPEDKHDISTVPTRNAELESIIKNMNVQMEYLAKTVETMAKALTVTMESIKK